jgi:DNA topoisomerase-3
MKITAELLNVKIETSDGNASVCPKCKQSKVRFYPKAVKCTNANCGLTVFRSRSERELTEKQITDLLTKGKTGIIKGFKSKAGKSFDAAIS